MNDERDQDIRELQYLLEVERRRRFHLQAAISETLKHTGKVCREEWTREQVDAYLREQMAITPPLPDSRILAGGATPTDWHAEAERLRDEMRQAIAVLNSTEGAPAFRAAWAADGLAHALKGSGRNEVSS